MTLPLVNALIIESDSDRARRISAFLGESTELSVHCERVDCLSAGETLLETGRWDFAVARLRLPDAKGLDALVRVDARLKDLPVIAILEGGEPEAVIDAAKSLAHDCVFWEEVDGASLSRSIECALERGKMLEELRARQLAQTAIAGESLYRDLIDRIDEAVFVVSEDSGAILFANETAGSWFGELLGETVLDLLEYDLREVDSVEMEIFIRNPRFPNVALKSSRMKWAGQAACMIALRDISKQKQAEEAYLACRRKLDAIGEPPEAIDDSPAPIEEVSLPVEVECLDSEERSEGGRGKALVVDDEDALRMVLQSILNAFGFETILASDGMEALELYEANGDDVSLAIVDLNMPGVDGSEVFHRIRKDGRRIPILMISGLDDVDALPFDDSKDENSRFLMKPFGVGDVRNAVEELIGVKLADPVV